MKYPFPLIALLLASTALIGCTKNRWPSGVEKGATISISVGEYGLARCTVVRVEGEWITVEKGSREFSYQRDKVTGIHVH